MTAKTWEGLLRILALILGPLLNALTPTIRELLGDALRKVYAKALATPNPVDDYLVGFLLDVLQVPREE
jgi:hypothetical protein